MYIFEHEKGEKNIFPPLTFSLGKVIPRRVAPQQSPAPFRFTWQK